MSNDKKTLADVRPGGRVRLGDQARVKISDELLSSMAYAIPGAVETTEKAKEVAARVVEIYLSDQPRYLTDAYDMGFRDGQTLSAQPSPGGRRFHQVSQVAMHFGMAVTPEEMGEAIASAPSSRFSSESAAAAFSNAQPSPGGQDALLESLVARWRNHAEEIGVSDNLLCQKIANCTMRHAAELQAVLAGRQPVEASEGGFRAAASRQTASAESNATAEALIAAVRQPSKQPDSVALGEATEFCIEKGARQPVGQKAVVTSHWRDGRLNHILYCSPMPDGVHRLYAAPTAQVVDLGKVPHGIRLVEIPRRNGLDPINVFVQDYELGRGRIVVTCYGQAWCGFWGAMGDRTVMQFVAACDADYVAGNMLSGRHEHVKKHERTYVERIAIEVIAEFRALIDGKAVGNG